jgi:nicotinamidase-related amidase
MSIVAAGRTWGEGIALLVVDVQNDFVDPAGSLSVSTPRTGTRR